MQANHITTLIISIPIILIVIRTYQIEKRIK